MNTVTLVAVAAKHIEAADRGRLGWRLNPFAGRAAPHRAAPSRLQSGVDRARTPTGKTAKTRKSKKSDSTDLERSGVPTAFLVIYRM